MPVFTRTTTINTNPQELFRFHENPHNLRLIAPRGMQIVDIRAAVTARPGEEFTIAARQGPLRLSWTGRWEVATAPCLLIDRGMRCPFALWRHHHIFEPHGSGSLLTDRVEFRLPWRLGGPAGDLFCQLLLFPRMFAARHAATQRLFAETGS